MAGHSLLGASAAYRWLACPGSFRLSREHPDHRNASKYAAAGSVAHRYVEAGARNKSYQVDAAEIGRVWMHDGHPITVTGEMIQNARYMLDFLYEAEGRVDWLKIEARVSLDRYFSPPPPVALFGTLDAGMFECATGTLEIVDYKSGTGVTVSVTANPQLLFYAAGVFGEIAPVWREWVRKIKLTIVQPDARSGAPVTSWETSVVDLLLWVDEVLVPGVRACEDPGAPFNPGSWCRWCPVSHHCPAIHQAQIEKARDQFEEYV